MGAEATIELNAVRHIQPRALAPRLDMYALSHSGAVRAQNQDAWSIDPALGLVLIADGVGGQGNGAWASLRAVSLTRRFLRHATWKSPPASSATREKIILRALRFTNRCMRKMQSGTEGKASGTTLVGLWAPPDGDGTATAFNVGDSALFRTTEHGITKISRDHSLHQLWLEGGKNGTEPSKRVIVQALGISPQILPHQASFALSNGESYLICTDGLTGCLGLDEIAILVHQAETAELAARNLLTEALHNLAPDNVTASVCKVRNA